MRQLERTTLFCLVSGMNGIPLRSRVRRFESSLEALVKAIFRNYFH